MMNCPISQFKDFLLCFSYAKLTIDPEVVQKPVFPMCCSKLIRKISLVMEVKDNSWSLDSVRETCLEVEISTFALQVDRAMLLGGSLISKWSHVLFPFCSNISYQR